MEVAFCILGMCFKYMYVNDFGNWCDENLGLTDEVEVIEEDKKIKKLPPSFYENACLTKQDVDVANKINKIIDKINSMEVK